MKLAQEEYVDDNGKPVPASKVDQVSTYHHIADGFYEWYCSCGETYSSRACGWPIGGQVLYCEKCKKWNLLLRSDIKDVNRGMKFAIEYDNEKSVIDAYKKRTENAESFATKLRGEMSHILSHCQSTIQNKLNNEFDRLRKECTN